MEKGSSKWKIFRIIINEIHLYAGLISGLIVILVCLSGTCYVYQSELKEWMDSDRYFVSKSGIYRSLDTLKDELELELDAQVTGVMISGDTGRSIQFTLLEKSQTGRGTTYFVDPYSGEILADNVQRTATEEFVSYLFSLHRWLLLDRIQSPLVSTMDNRELGRIINGIATSLFLLGVLTGIVIWIPQKIKNWKQGLSIKWSANWKRVNHDIHNTLAFYSLIALFIMSATGLFWSFQWYRVAWQKTWDTYPAAQGDQSVKEPAGPALPFSLDQTLIRVQEVFPQPGNTRISFPKDSHESIGISFYPTGFFASPGADQLKLDPGSYEVLEAKLFSDLSIRQQIGRSVKYLHTGEIFGMFSKFIWFIACLIATSLPITGTLIWWNKRKKKKKSRRSKD